MKHNSIKELKKRRKEILKNFNLPTKLLGIPAPYVSYFVINFTKLSANAISLFWVALATIGISLIAVGNYSWTITGIILAHIAMMLDQVDGDTAIARKERTMVGPHLDKIAEILHRSLLLFAVGIGLYNLGFSIFYFYAGSITALLFMFQNSIELKIKEIIYSYGKIDKYMPKTKATKKSKKITWKRELSSYLRTAEPGNLVYILLILNLQTALAYLLIFYFVMIPLLFLRKSYVIYKKAEKIDY